MIYTGTTKDKIIYDIHAYHSFKDLDDLKKYTPEQLLNYLPPYETEYWQKQIK